MTTIKQYTTVQIWQGKEYPSGQRFNTIKEAQRQAEAKLAADHSVGEYNCTYTVKEA